jgi:hypothetical protein
MPIDTPSATDAGHPVGKAIMPIDTPSATDAGLSGGKNNHAH